MKERQQRRLRRGPTHERPVPSRPDAEDEADLAEALGDPLVLDIGTSKIVCLIAKLKPREGSDILPNRTHLAEIIGFGHTRARGMKAGAIADMEKARPRSARRSTRPSAWPRCRSTA